MDFGDELPLQDRQWITRLSNAHNRELAELAKLRDYYEGQQPLSYMHPELLDTLDDRVRQVVVNWPQLVVDALEERIDLTGSGWAASPRGTWRPPPDGSTATPTPPP
jgi:hypothetical protein